MGAMAASIAHEINQPLGAVVANANAGLRFLASKPSDLAEAREALSEIIKAGHRAGEVIGGIRAMFKKDTQVKAWLDVNHVILEVLALLDGELKNQFILVSRELSEGLPLVPGVRVQLQQVILNLLTNAIEAMSTTSSRRVLRVSSELRGTDDILVVVEDSGSGIEPKNIEHIFDPFFTTKNSWHGYGLVDLSIHHRSTWRSTHGVALSHWGLNISNYLAGRGGTRRAMTDHPEPQPVVFIIDDDELLRDGLKRLLRSVGLQAETFGSAREFALRRLPDAARCLLLDVRLPSVSGLDFQAELARAGIRIPIIFMTGHGDIPMTVQAMKAGAVEFLTKPFREQDLLDAVGAALERDRVRRESEKAESSLRTLFDTLTPREQEVLSIVSTGLMNKQVAGKLGVSEIMVKVHRGNVMRKMGARSLADLVIMSEVLGVRRSRNGHTLNQSIDPALSSNQSPFPYAGSTCFFVLRSILRNSRRVEGPRDFNHRRR